MSEQKQEEPLLEQKFSVAGGDFIHAGEISEPGWDCPTLKTIRMICISHQ